MKKLLFCLLPLLFATIIKADAQDIRIYKKYEIIELTNGLKVEILGNRGEGPSREVDLIYYTVKRQTGKRMWQLASVLFQEENAALIAKGLKPLYKIPEPVKPSIDTLHVTTPKVETVINIPKKVEIAIEEEVATEPVKPIIETLPVITPKVEPVIDEIKKVETKIEEEAVPEPVKPLNETLPVTIPKVEPVIENIKKEETKIEEEAVPEIKSIREIKGPNPARKPLKEIDSIAVAVVIPSKIIEEPVQVFDSLSKEPIIAINYRVIIPSYDSGARHNYVIGLDSNNNPFLIDDTISADFFTKPYNDLIPPEVIEAFKKDVIFPLPIYIPIEDKKTEAPKPEIPKAEPPVLPKKVAGKS